MLYHQLEFFEWREVEEVWRLQGSSTKEKAKAKEKPISLFLFFILILSRKEVILFTFLL